MLVTNPLSCNPVYTTSVARAFRRVFQLCLDLCNPVESMGLLEGHLLESHKNIPDSQPEQRLLQTELGEWDADLRSWGFSMAKSHPHWLMIPGKVHLAGSAGRALPAAFLGYGSSQVMAAEAGKYKLPVTSDMVQFPSSLQEDESQPGLRRNTGWSQVPRGAS